MNRRLVVLAAMLLTTACLVVGARRAYAYANEPQPTTIWIRTMSGGTPAYACWDVTVGDYTVKVCIEMANSGTPAQHALDQ